MIEIWFTTMEQAVACAPVTQRARVQSLVGQVTWVRFFQRFFLTCKINVRKV